MLRIVFVRMEPFLQYSYLRMLYPSQSPGWPQKSYRYLHVCNAKTSLCNCQCLFFFKKIIFELQVFLYSKMDDDLGCNNIQKHEKWAVLQNYLLDVKDEVVREETIYFCSQIEYYSARFISSRLNCQENRGLEIKSSRKPCRKLQKSFIKCVREINHILKKLPYVNLPCVAAVSLQLISEFRVFGMIFSNICKHNLLSYIQPIRFLF